MLTLITEMAAGYIILLASAVCIGSILIGAVGIGGVVVLPVMVTCGVPPATGIVSVFIGFLPATFFKLLLLARIEGLIPRRVGFVAATAAAIGSAVGGMIVSVAPKQVLAVVVGTFALLAGLMDVAKYYLAMRAKSRSKSEQTEVGNPLSHGDTRAEAKLGEHGEMGDETVLPVGSLPVPSMAHATNGAQLMSIADSPQASSHPYTGHGEGTTVAAAAHTPLEAVPEAANTQVPGTALGRFRRMMSSAVSIPQDERWEPTNRELCIVFVIGLITGFGSVLTGTGGPLIFLPIVLTWKGSSVNPKTVIGASTVMAVFLSVAAVISTLASGLRPDFGLVLLLMAFSLVGIFIGVRVLELVSRDTLQICMAVLLLSIAVVTIVQAAHDTGGRDTRASARAT